MTTAPSQTNSATRPELNARRFRAALVEAGVTEQVGTPCGILAPLWVRQSEADDMVTLSREDTALAYAAGQALTGAYPAILMQNSGFGNCINVMGSLVCAFNLRLALVVSLRGTDNDSTPENLAMGRVTESVLRMLGVPIFKLDNLDKSLDPAFLKAPGPKAVLVAPGYFGWTP